MPLNVFLSYAKEDQGRAVEYYDLLLQEGVNPWMDVKCILPGQNWETEIDKAISDANIIILLLSKKSVNKRGFVQREVNEAIERLRYKQPTDIYIIPLLLEQCDIPSYISTRIQYIDLSSPMAWDKVRESLVLAAKQQSIDLVQGMKIGPFRVFSKVLEDSWTGTPGHNIKIEYPRFQSTRYPKFAEELTYFFCGRATQALIESRQNPWDQWPDRFPKTGEFISTNGRWDEFGIVHTTDNFLSLVYQIGWYGAGAAHPNNSFQTYNVSMLDRIILLRLNDFFSDFKSAIIRISEICIAELSHNYWNRTGEHPDQRQLDWFKSGAGAEIDNFRHFTVSAKHFTFLFAPYQVSSFAMGTWSTDVSFYKLHDLLKPGGPHLLAASAHST